LFGLNIFEGKNALLYFSKREEKVAVDATFNVNVRGTFEIIFFKFTAMRVPRQCPLVLLVLVGYVWMRHLEVQKARRKSGTRSEVEPGLTAFLSNFEFCY
jgi:hypothetical protein